MKILVFSDSHGSVWEMERAIASHPDAEYVLHAGDGAREFLTLREKYPEKAFAGVAGNRDFMLDSDEKPLSQCTLDIGGVRFFLTHGHKFFVKSSTYAIIEYAQNNNIDIAVFGHTHLPLDVWLPDVGKRGVRLFNPGTISGAGSGRRTYGIIDIRPNGVLTSHGKIS